MPRGAAGRGPPTAARTVFRLNRFGVPPRGQRSPSQAAAALLPPVPPTLAEDGTSVGPGGRGAAVGAEAGPATLREPTSRGRRDVRPSAVGAPSRHTTRAGCWDNAPLLGSAGNQGTGGPTLSGPRPSGNTRAGSHRGAPGPQHELCLRRDPAHLPLARGCRSVPSKHEPALRGRPRPCFGKRLLLLAGCRLLPSALRVNKTLNSHTKPDSCQRPRAARCPLRFTEEETEARGRYVAKADTRWQRTEEETGSHSQGPRPNAEDRSEPPGGMGRAPHTA